MWNPFRNRQAEHEGRFLLLETAIAESEKQVRALRLELAEVSDRVYRWMKAAQRRSAVDAERTVSVPAPAAPPPVAPAAARTMWGARGRRAMAALARGMNPDTAPEPGAPEPEESNGVHS